MKSKYAGHRFYLTPNESETSSDSVKQEQHQVRPPYDRKGSQKLLGQFNQMVRDEVEEVVSELRSGTKPNGM